MERRHMSNMSTPAARAAEALFSCADTVIAVMMGVTIVASIIILPIFRMVGVIIVPIIAAISVIQTVSVIISKKVNQVDSRRERTLLFL